MAVVEQQAPERMPQSQHMPLGISSLLGAVLVMFAIGFVLGGIPAMWESALGISEAISKDLTPVINEFLASALLLMTMIVVGLGLAYVLRQLERSSSQPGLRSGVFFAAVAIYFVLGLATMLGDAMVKSAAGEVEMMHVGIVVIVAAAMAAAVLWLFTRPGFGRWLVRIEEQGWFHAVSYKGNQGVRVRRGTIIALLAVGVCGIITIVTGRSLGTSRLAPNDWRPNDWNWEIPFTDVYVPIIYEIHVMVPFLLAILSLWVAWRVVNWPAFADFLIATEAEINKVSWTTRRRLFQDTIVVLVTVFLFTAFLFVVDIIWIKVLTNPYIQVLQIDIKQEYQKQQEKTQW